MNEIENLKKLNIKKLRQMWQEKGLRGDPPSVKSLLLRELAWHLQHTANDGFDLQTQSLLKAAMRLASKNAAHLKLYQKKIPRTKKAKIQTGAKLIRKWQGRTYEVTVLDNGKSFSYNNEVYSSLSSIAEKITGSHWSGPRFFGLNQRKVST